MKKKNGKGNEKPFHQKGLKTKNKNGIQTIISFAVNGETFRLM